MKIELLANPEKWLPPVDQVDRPYFIVIDRKNRVYSEFTDFDVLDPVRGSRNNWYEEVDRKAVKYFIVKGRFGYYWVDMDSGLFYVAAQHKMGKHPLVQYALSVSVEGTILTRPLTLSQIEVENYIPYKYTLKHFKSSEVEMMAGEEPPTQGMNTRGIKPKDHSQTAEVIFGWELNTTVGRVTFEGIVFNRRPRFDLRLLYSLPEDFDGEAKRCSFKMMNWDAKNQQEREKTHIVAVRKGEVMKWQERIL